MIIQLPDRREWDTRLWNQTLLTSVQEIPTTFLGRPKLKLGMELCMETSCCCAEAAALWTVLAMLWEPEDGCWLSSHRAPNLEPQPSALEAAAQRNSSSIFHYQLSDQVTTLFIFIPFSTLPLPLLSFLTFTSFPSLQDTLSFPKQAAFLGKDTNSFIFPFPYTVKLRFVGRHLYLAITVPMTPFMTVFSHCTLLSDTHTAPTTAQMNSGK